MMPFEEAQTTAVALVAATGRLNLLCCVLRYFIDSVAAFFRQ